MFWSLMTIIRELCLYVNKVIFMFKTLGKITSLYKLGDVATHVLYIKQNCRYLNSGRFIC